MQFGSFQVPIRTNAGEHVAWVVEHPDRRRNEEVENVDRGLEAEVERHARADCNPVKVIRNQASYFDSRAIRRLASDDVGVNLQHIPRVVGDDDGG
jgi:hypothetical protein